MWKLRSILLLTIALLLVSCFRPPSAPILDGEQRMIIENGTYEFDYTNGDTAIVIHFTYYVSSGVCDLNSYSIDWRNGYMTSGNWDPFLQLNAGTWYTINDRYRKRMWGDEVTQDPIITFTAYIANGYPELAFRSSDTLSLK